MSARFPTFWPLFLLVLVAGCAAPRASWVRDRQGKEEGAAPSAPAAGARTHRVEAGENLYRISLRYGVDQDELARLNGIDDPTALAVGTELRLPAGAKGGSPAPAPGGAAATATISASQPKGRNPILQWPVKGVLYSRFGQRGASRHDGIDIAAPEGTPIVAAADGEVIFAGVQRGYGNLVILRHEDGLVTIYAHNKENLVREGARLRQGEVLGKVGRTGRATGPHCHFEVRRGVTPLEPLDFLPP